MSVLARLKQALSRTSSPPFDPAAYWEDRHRALTGSIRAVGHLGLPESANALQYDVKRTQILNLIRQYAGDPSGKRLLDAGCGTGVLSAAYAALGFDVLGVDFSATAIAQAQAAGIPAAFVAAPLHTLALGRRFDVVTVIDVLLHIVDEGELRATLAALARHLAPSGVLVMLDCCADNGPHSARHVRHRSLAWYTRAFADVGLCVAEHQRFALDAEGSIKDLLALRYPLSA